MSAQTTDLGDLDAIGTYFTTVVRVQRRSPHLIRVTFGGGDLAQLQWLSPDQFFYVLLPPRGQTTMSIDRTFTWEQVRTLPHEQQPRGAYYTLRHHRADVAEVDLDMVLHGDDGEASAWAARAQPGDVAALWGPRTAYSPPDDTQWYLLVADETGLPALGAILEHLPADAVVRAVIEVADEHERQPLTIGPNVEVVWLHRDGAAAGTTGRLTEHVDAARGGWPDGHVYAWGGGESHEMTAIRRYLRHDVGVEAHRVSMTGYWRRAGAR